jgi:hypothetical protein
MPPGWFGGTVEEIHFGFIIALVAVSSSPSLLLRWAIVPSQSFDIHIQHLQLLRWCCMKHASSSMVVHQYLSSCKQSLATTKICFHHTRKHQCDFALSAFGLAHD